MPLDQLVPTNPMAQTPNRMPPSHRKRTISFPSTIKMSSAKRRRKSTVSVELTNELRPIQVEYNSQIDSPDRFVPLRPKTAVPLNVTPRTNRISRQFGLMDDRVLNFKENENPSLSGSSEVRMMGMLRRSASSLFHAPPSLHPVSVTENLLKSKQCLLTLDGPGISGDPFAFPISWSKTNLITVACQNEIFYQNLDTREVSLLCQIDEASLGQTRVIEWAGDGWENILASGTTTGNVLIWDVNRHEAARSVWSSSCEPVSVGAFSWHGALLAGGFHNGTVILFDVREKDRGLPVAGHKGDVLAVKWSPDGNCLASSDEHGSVYIWDMKAGKSRTELGPQGHRMRHSAPVKALAWCPWKSGLLATGGIQPDGKIHIWNTLSNAPCPTPAETISLDTSILSLHWSPHCKELLSTHGSSFVVPSRPRANSTGSRHSFRPVVTPLTYSIAVHEYPSRKRLLTLKAHLGAVSQSCLSPDGQKLFTVCPREEAIKMWHVWGKPPPKVRKESSFDKWSIR